jgi:hypothetical protein
MVENGLYASGLVDGTASSRGDAVRFLFRGFGFLGGALFLRRGGSSITRSFGVSVRQGTLFARLAQHLPRQCVVPEALGQLLTQLLGVRSRARDRFCNRSFHQKR